MRVHAETLEGRVERMIMVTLPDRAALERMRGLVAEGGALVVRGVSLEVFISANIVLLNLNVLIRFYMMLILSQSLLKMFKMLIWPGLVLRQI